MAQEIERKFILNSLPEGLKYRKKEYIRQGYLSVSADQDIRIRQKGRWFFQTIKKGSGILRQETEIRLSRKQFEELWSLANGFSLEKTRYNYDWKGYILEIDQYFGDLEGLFTAEIEFPGIKEAYSIIIPDFFREEITFDPRYKNKSLIKISSREINSLLSLDQGDKIIGTIPFFREKDEIKVILVTSRKKNQWIFPKGQDEKDLQPEETALLEADEEAGIKGRIYAAPVRVPYIKGKDKFNMLAFPVEVRRLKDKWREDKWRKREVVSIRDAYKLSTQKAVHCGLEYLEVLTEVK